MIKGITNAPNANEKCIACIYGSAWLGSGSECNRSNNKLPPVSRKPIAKPCNNTEKHNTGKLVEKGIIKLPIIQIQVAADNK